MTRLRLAAVHGLLALLVGGQAVALVGDAEWWPFSPYPMYSRVRTAAHVEYRLYGVPAGPAPAEFSLLEREYVRPFQPQNLRGRLQGAGRREPVLRGMVAAVGRRYEALRRRGAHAGPPLHAVRLYRFRWSLESARPGAAPAERSLVLELTRAELGDRDP